MDTEENSVIMECQRCKTVRIIPKYRKFIDNIKSSTEWCNNCEDFMTHKEKK